MSATKVVNEDGTITVTLRKPVKMTDREISSLTFRAEATAEDLQAMDKAGDGQVARSIRLIAELTDQTVTVIKRTSARDYMDLLEISNEVTGLGKDETGETGETS